MKAVLFYTAKENRLIFVFYYRQALGYLAFDHPHLWITVSEITLISWLHDYVYTTMLERAGVLSKRPVDFVGQAMYCFWTKVSIF